MPRVMLFDNIDLEWDMRRTVSCLRVLGAGDVIFDDLATRDALLWITDPTKTKPTKLQLEKYQGMDVEYAKKVWRNQVNCWDVVTEYGYFCECHTIEGWLRTYGWCPVTFREGATAEDARSEKEMQDKWAKEHPKV